MATTQIVIAAAIGIALIVALIVFAKLNPFISLLVSSGVVAAVAGVDPSKLLNSFTAGFGSTLGGVGALIALGAIIGALLLKSGGANSLVDRLLATSSVRLLPWAVALVAAIVGIPMFFETGVVLLIPLVMLIARRAKVPVLLVGIPMLVGLGQMHALVPPHPGPLAVIDVLGADLGTTMFFGFVVAIPMIALGALVAPLFARMVPVMAPEDDSSTQVGSAAAQQATRQPRFGWTVATVVLPVVLMLGRTVGELTLPQDSGLLQVLIFLGTPIVALTLTVLLAIVTLGFGAGLTMDAIGTIVSGSFGSIAGVLLIVGAGGGFKQTLVDIGVGNVVASVSTSLALSPMLVAWVIAALIRAATGSATVAALTAAGLVSPLVAGLDTPHAALLVLAVGLGSGFLSHVNDAGFWMVKEFFGLTVGQTFKTWSLLTVILPVVGLGLVGILWVAT